MDHAIQRLLDLPHFLHADLVDLRGVLIEQEVIAQHAGKVALRALADDGDLGAHLDTGLERGELLALTPAALVAGLDTHNAAVLHQQLLRVGLGQHVRTELLGAWRRALLR